MLGSIVLQLPWLSLHGDVRYTLGVLRASEAAGLTATEIFTHRPLANRVLMAGLDSLTGGPPTLRERVLFTAAVLAAALACWALTAALARHLGSGPNGTSGRHRAGILGAVVFLALAWAPGSTLLQPEWVALVLGVAGTAAGLAAAAETDPLLWLVLGSAFALAALQKYTTAATVAVAVLVLLLALGRRALPALPWTAACILAGFVLTLTAGSREWQWFVEMPQLNQTGGTNWAAFAQTTWNQLWVHPALALWPATLVLWWRAESRLGARDRRWVLGAIAAVIVVLGSVIYQNSYLPYHYALLPLPAALVLGWAGLRWWEETVTIPYAVALGAPWLVLAGWLGDRPLDWRTAHPLTALAAVLAFGVLAVLLAVGQPVSSSVDYAGRPSAAGRRRAGWATALIVTLLVTFPAWPSTPYSFDARYAGMKRADLVADTAELLAEGAQVRAATGEVPVVYLAFGDRPYAVGLPSRCVYPAATFLSRNRYVPTGRLRSAQENLACLRDPAAAFLVWQPSFAPLRTLDPAVRSAVAADWDCARPVVSTRSMVVCRRR